MFKELWTKAEDRLLKKHYSHTPWLTLTKLLKKRTRVAIRSHAEVYLGLRRQASGWSRYTDRERAIITRMFGRADREEILRRVPGHSWSSIMVYARSVLGLSRERANRLWSAKELAILGKFYSVEPVSQLAARLPGRTEHGIVHQARVLGLFHECPGGLWRPGEVVILKKFYPVEPVEKLLPRLPSRTIGGISKKAKALGLRGLAKFLYSGNSGSAGEHNVAEDKKWLEGL